MARPKQIKEETILAIRSLYARDEYTQQELAKQFELSQSTICKIVNNYIHKSVTNVILGGNADIRLGKKFTYGN